MDHVPELDLWRRNVGADVTLDLAQPAQTPLSGLRVLCWNLAVGKARLGDILFALLDGRIPDATPTANRPLLVLAQEAYRSDASVPASVHGRHHGGLHPRAARNDIVELAREFGLSLCYSPSMRNGLHDSDRGNAILATAALEPGRAFVLPFSRQRRVVVTATLRGLPTVRFASAHLDIRRRLRPGGTLPRGHQARALVAQLAGDDQATILGADLNSFFGMRDPVVRTLVRGGFQPGRRRGAWRHTYHRPRLGLLFDHVLHRPGGELAMEIDVRRLDEDELDRGASVFGSDHHPLLADVSFREGEREGEGDRDGVPGTGTS